jgi:hypothetical protein
MNKLILIVLILVLSCSVFAQKKPVVAKNQIASSCQLTEAPSLRELKIGQTPDDIDKFMSGFASEYQRQLSKQDGDLSNTDFSAPWEGRLTWSDIGGAYISGYFDENYNFVLDMSDGNGNTSSKLLQFSGDKEDLKQITFWFFSNKLYAYTIHYSEYDPPTAQSFIKQLSEKINLPRNGWILLDKSNISAVLKCNGFKVNVHTAYRNAANLTVTDTNTEAEIIRLEKQIKLERKQEAQRQLREEQRRRDTLKP